MARFFVHGCALSTTALLALSSLALSGCSSPVEVSSPTAAGGSATSDPAIPASSVTAPGANPEPPDARPLPDLAPCPGINPDIRRPAGSNCLGLLPEQCGADRVADALGQTDTPALRASVARRSGHANIRWIGEGEPVIENLDPGRLNLQLDARRRIVKVDCY